MALEVGGAADIGGLTPPALSAPHPLTPFTPTLSFSVAMEGCCMQGMLELGGARIQLLGRTRRQSACMHAHAHTPTHAMGIDWAMHLIFRTAWHSGQAGAWGCAQTCPCACVFAHECCLAARSCSHTLCALPSQLGWQGVSPFKKHTLGCLENCVTSRARASPIFSVARNAPPNYQRQ